MPNYAATIKEMKKSIHIICLGILSLFILFTCLTYFDALSQYPTADQINTLERIDSFLIDKQSPVATGSHFTFVTIGILGSLLEKILDSQFQLQDHIIGNIHFNRFLPYTFFSVIFSLILILFCVKQLANIMGWKIKEDLILYMYFFIMISNLPLLKAMSKILKYDILSLLWIILSTLTLIRYLQSSKSKFFFQAVLFSAFSFYEKDSTFMTIFFLMGVEIYAKIIWETKPKVKECFLQLIKGGILFIIIGAILMPITWKQPIELVKYFYRIYPNYLSALPLYSIILAFPILALLIYFKKAVRNLSISIYQSKTVVFAILFTPLICILLAYFYQNNNAWLPPHLPKATIEELISKKIFLDGGVHLSITTFDHSKTITRIKIFIDNIRSLIYFQPEIILFFYLLPLYLLILNKTSTRLKKTEPFWIVMIAFLVSHLGAQSFALAPLDPKYILNSSLVFTIMGTVIFLSWFQTHRNSLYFVTRLFLIGSLCFLWNPLTENRPSYLGWMNILRDRKIENRESMILGNSGWTWVGWGESLYPAEKWLQRNGRLNHKTKLYFDYSNLAIPNYIPENLTIHNKFDSQYHQLSSIKDIQDWARRLHDNEAVDYVLVTKILAFRYLGPNSIVKNFSDRALFTEIRSGVEYAWLFSTLDLLKSKDI